MDSLLQRAVGRGKSLEADETLRLQKRPNKTNTFEDFGSSFSKRSNDAGHDARKTTSSTYNYGGKLTKPASRDSTQELSDSSDDELDLLSQTSHITDDEFGPPKSSQAPESNDYICRLNGTTKSTHMAIKAMKFKRNNGSMQTDSAARISSKELDNNGRPSPNIHRNGSQNFVDYEHTRTRGTTYSSSNSHTENSNRPKARLKHHSSTRQELALEEISINSQAPKPKSWPMSKTEAVQSEAGLDTPYVESRRRPAIDINLTRQSTLVKVKHVDEDESCTPQSKDRAKEKFAGRMMLTATMSTPTIKKPSIDRSIFQSSEAMRTPKAFPAPSPLSLRERAYIPQSPSMPDLTAKQRSRSGSPKLRPREFPIPLPNKDSGRESRLGASDDGRTELELPMPRSKFKSKKAKKSNISDSHGLNKEVEELSRPAPQPFPMDAQMLSGIGTASLEAPNGGDNEGLNKEAESSSSSRPAPQPFPMNAQMLSCIGAADLATPSVLRKRTSDVTSLKSRKRGRKGDLEAHSSSDESNFDKGHDWEEDFSMSLSVDPNLLCPFCDTLLPVPPTPHLKKLIHNALKKSRPDTRPSNPLGRKAPSAVFVTICQRHQFESEELPRAEANGWPKSIDWDRLSDRVKVMRDDLESLLVNLRTGAGASFFWEDVKRELQAKGSRAVASVQGQFANFEMTQPGYYGELGYAIIHQTLLDLFPPTSCDLNFTTPLAPEQFVQRVLVPEVATRLIQEDMGLSGVSGLSKALQVLRNSSKYGVAMFPDDSADDGKGDFADPDQMGVADLIVMERARKRRKELKEEDSREQGKEEERQMEERGKKKKGRKKTKAKEKEKEGCSQTEVEQASQPKPRPKAKSRSTRRTPLDEDSMNYLSFPESSQDMAETGNVQRPKPRPKPKHRSTNHERHGPTSHDEASEDIMDHYSSFPESSQNSIMSPKWKSYAKSRSEYETTETEEEMSAPNSDLDKGSGFPFFAPTSTRNPQSSMNTQSDNFAKLPKDMDVSPTIRRRHKKRRDSESENEKDTPKPAKVGRTGLLGPSASNSHPLLLARQRAQKHKEPIICDTETDGSWCKTMLSPSSSLFNSASLTFRPRSDIEEFHWLLSDCSQEAS